MASAFPRMALTHGDGTTTLTGELRDQAELQGMLLRVSDLGLTLLETNVVQDRPATRSGHEPANADAAGPQAPAAPRTSRERN